MTLVVKTQIHGKALAQVEKGFRQLSVSGVNEEVSLKQFARDAENFIKRHFPKSSRYVQKENDQSKDYEGHLRAGWKGEAFLNSGGTTGAQSVVRVFNTMALKSPRVEAILKALDRGSRAYVWHIPSDFAFVTQGRRFHYSDGNYSAGGTAWTRLSGGDDQEREARPGLHFIDATERHIRFELLPRMRQVIIRKVADLV